MSFPEGLNATPVVLFGGNVAGSEYCVPNPVELFQAKAVRYGVLIAAETIASSDGDQVTGVEINPGEGSAYLVPKPEDDQAYIDRPIARTLPEGEN
jgi:hypothetical protein